MTYYNVLGNFLNCYSPIATESNECVLCECITQLAIVVLLHIVYLIYSHYLLISALPEWRY